ncbi:Threonine synthase [Lunatimonas lonarensis]|uniref:Threonine synthase n=1 Tax=Lunatimonas lonarensis TaxID=1232681 RepID=R7ZPG4_9BACT|nr:threonine synthase [Lunatimonas lonarensis]EON75914.1 Threonine synthase [Lunatimonas lonarensis]
MRYFSTNDRRHSVSLQEAVIKGLAPDQGLYMPERMPLLAPERIARMRDMSFREIGYEVIGALFSEDLSVAQITDLVDHTLQFDAPIVQIEDHIFSLELFHGPTLAFKDFGARFCSKLMSLLLDNQKVRVLVATSGDTGSAVANGFFGIDGVEVVILYPSGKVSELQEKQFTTLGGNVVALEVDGVFDDCQRMVKEAFLDPELQQSMLLTSANSINIARWIPQCLYYFYAVSRLPQDHGKVVFSVPSGNFGNIAAGMLAERMGLPIHTFVAATNVNKVVPDYLGGSPFTPKSSIQTISNSMDVGNPSNFYRLLALYDGDEKVLREKVKGCYYTDEETRKAMVAVKHSTGYVMDPHGAVAYLGLKDFLASQSERFDGIFLETAHPGKFRDVVEATLGDKINLPSRLLEFMKGEKKTIPLANDYTKFKEFLIRTH